MQLKHKILVGVLSVAGVVGVALSQYRSSHASVSLHGVNYSDREFSYFISDPENPQKTIGGEHIAPFAGGGTTCCAVLPWKWKPGTKVRLTTTHWLKKLPDGSLPEVTEEHEVEVPEYAEAGELWVIRNGEGKISVVSSNVQPDHLAWPGEIKGWPVPSVQYQRERWEIYRDVERSYVDAFESLLKELEQDPDNHVIKMWKHDTEYSSSEITGFTGPNDPRYIRHLKKTYIEGLKRSRSDLEEIMKAKP
ncbi:DUF3304 domain-containing protein [Massilia sp. LC238]|uniref:DUF3304 domain-containing protein n=1 Tax=Massilia sp. LC238 TaxID=1502852 RepID=UPI0004E329C5|nr:DUF3304 domain-containing protein [Massilia sp. LC238]KFC68482.1 hypothetical protein FG94_02683 [Massilia sp. LC238]